MASGLPLPSQGHRASSLLLWALGHGRVTAVPVGSEPDELQALDHGAGPPGARGRFWGPGPQGGRRGWRLGWGVSLRTARQGPCPVSPRDGHGQAWLSLTWFACMKTVARPWPNPHTQGPAASCGQGGRISVDVDLAFYFRAGAMLRLSCRLLGTGYRGQARSGLDGTGPGLGLGLLQSRAAGQQEGQPLTWCCSLSLSTTDPELWELVGHEGALHAWSLHTSPGHSPDPPAQPPLTKGAGTRRGRAAFESGCHGAGSAQARAPLTPPRAQTLQVSPGHSESLPLGDGSDARSRTHRRKTATFHSKTFKTD